jgi:hypothetical protein
VQRFQKFIGRKIDFEKLKEPQSSTAAGVTERYVPDELDVFEEMEFGAGPWKGQDVIFTIVLEEGKLARISLGFIPPGGSEDDMVAFNEAQLKEVLADKGDTLELFFESILPKSPLP